MYIHAYSMSWTIFELFQGTIDEQENDYKFLFRIARRQNGALSALKLSLTIKVSGYGCNRAGISRKLIVENQQMAITMSRSVEHASVKADRPALFLSRTVYGWDRSRWDNMSAFVAL